MLLPMKPGTNVACQSPGGGMRRWWTIRGATQVASTRKGVPRYQERVARHALGAPTGMMWGDPERYAKQYFERFADEEYFFCGDCGAKGRGRVHLGRRSVQTRCSRSQGTGSGHSSSNRSIVSHPAASEAAVVAIPTR